MPDTGGKAYPDVFRHYRVVRELGRGGMGIVFEGRDMRVETRVAIKVLNPELAYADPSFRERFEGEAHVAALLRSPYTVQLLDFGVEQGFYFLVMEFVEGQSLADILRNGPMPPDRALRVAREVAHALEEAQARGVVHRDIKPENILLDNDGRVKVADFGIARRQNAPGLTTAGGFVGTATYAAPEQDLGEADHRTDIYQLGATLYHMLAGRPPFVGSNLLEIRRQHRMSTVPMSPLANMPDPVTNVIRRCMDKEPLDRYQTAAELAGALERARMALGRWQAEQPATTPPVARTETAPVARPDPTMAPLPPPGASPPAPQPQRTLQTPPPDMSRDVRQAPAAYQAPPAQPPRAPVQRTVQAPMPDMRQDVPRRAPVDDRPTTVDRPPPLAPAPAREAPRPFVQQQQPVAAPPPPQAPGGPSAGKRPWWKGPAGVVAAGGVGVAAVVAVVVAMSSGGGNGASPDDTPTPRSATVRTATTEPTETPTPSPTLPPKPGDVLFGDTFSRDSGFSYDADDSQGYYDGDHFVIQMKAGNLPRFTQTEFLESATNLSINLAYQVEHPDANGGSSFIIIGCRESSAGEYRAVLFTNEARIERVDAGGATNLGSNFATTDLAQKNNLIFVCNGGTLTLSIGATLLVTASDSTFTEGSAYFGAGTINTGAVDTRTLFDSIQVTVP